jgi:hypothetical protein
LLPTATSTFFEICHILYPPQMWFKHTGSAVNDGFLIQTLVLRTHRIFGTHVNQSFRDSIHQWFFDIILRIQISYRQP